MNRYSVARPTSEECDKRDIVYDSEAKYGVASWYPQMGGYASRCVVVLDKEHSRSLDGYTLGGCIDIAIWHDGMFPTDDDRPSQWLHVCDPWQWVRFFHDFGTLNDERCVHAD